MILCYDAIMENERLLRQLARDITEDVLGDYGISNFWEWRYDDGGGDIEHGHGYGYELSAQVEHPMLTTPNL